MESTNNKVGIVSINLNLVKDHIGINALSCSGNNLGNILFTHAAYQHVISPLHVDFEFQDKIPEINANFSSILIPAANWIISEPDFGFLAKQLVEINIPICCVGLGAQVTLEELNKIPDGTIEFLKVLSQKSSLIGIRGEKTQRILNALGIQNTSVCGCPSIFPSLRLLPAWEKPSFGPTTRLSISFTRYGKHDPHKGGSQRKIAELAAKIGNSIVLQSESPEIEYIHTPSPETAQWLCQYYSIPDLELPALVGKMRYFTSQENWVQFHRENTDFTISSRIHGCIASLLAGKPSLLLAHDQRTSELAETMGIPQRPIECVNSIETKEDVLNLIRGLDYTDFFAKQITNLEKLTHLYKTCGLETCI